MKHVFTLLLLFLAFGAFSQNSKSESNSEASSPKPEVTGDLVVRSRAIEAPKLTYDVNDKYMGRAAEFLGNLTVKELPSDFPAYEKQWSLKEYNLVVTAFYYNHMSIVREHVKEKLNRLEH